MLPYFEDVAAADLATHGLRRYAGVTPPQPVAQMTGSIADSMFDSAPPLPLPGKLEFDKLAGRRIWHYELSERIGAGGMGVVYKARHSWLGRTVAVKFLTFELIDHPEGLARFAQEALAIGALDHENIVRAMDAGALEGVHFLVTEFVEGQDLSKLVRPGRPLAAVNACEIVRQAALGLEHAHRRGLVHRDIKPSNLIVNSDGVVKLLDFGLARISAGQTTLTSTGQLVGTLDFLAPEQAADSRSVDIRADIYSLGCTLYFLLTGRAPFAGPEYTTPASKIHAHLADQPRPVAQSARPVPLAVLDCLERMMAKNPPDRFQSPLDVARALAPWARGANLAELVANPEADGQRQAPQQPLAERILDRGTLAARAVLALAKPAKAPPHLVGRHRSRQPIFSLTGIVTFALVAYVMTGFTCSQPRHPRQELFTPAATLEADPRLSSAAPPAGPAVAIEPQSGAGGSTNSVVRWFKQALGRPAPQRVDNPHVGKP